MMSRSKRVFIERISSGVSTPERSTVAAGVDIYRCPKDGRFKFDLAGVTLDDVQV